MAKTCLLVFFSLSIFVSWAQDKTKVEGPVFKNQISTNLMLPLTGSVGLNYERTIANKCAIGIGAAHYGDGFRELTTYYFGDYYNTSFEAMLFGRLYFNGTQKKSHFLEALGSLINAKENGTIRYVDDNGHGVYTIGEKTGSGLNYLMVSKCT